MDLDLDLDLVAMEMIFGENMIILDYLFVICYLWNGLE